MDWWRRRLTIELVPADRVSNMDQGLLALLDPGCVAALQALAAHAEPPGVVLDAGPGGLGVAAATVVAAEALAAASPSAGDDAAADLRVARPDGDAWTVEEVDERILTAAAMRPVVMNAIVVDRADRMSARAADRLLKTIECPPAASWFVLVATDASRLPVTVRGRMAATVTLQRRAGDELTAELHAKGASVPQAEEIALLAGELVDVALEVAAGGDTAWEQLQALDLGVPAAVKDRTSRFAALVERAAPAMGLDVTPAARELIRQAVRLGRRAASIELRTGESVDPSWLTALDDAERLLELNVPPKSVFAGLAALSSPSS